MSKIFEAFIAGSTVRWHTNERLSGSHDRLDGHCARVARIIMMLNPAPSPELIFAALTHDDGEHRIGDLKGDAKSMLPDEVRACFERIEEKAIIDIWGRGANLVGDELLWLKFADRFDAVIWAAFHAPDLMLRPDWMESIAWCRSAADMLGIDERDFNAALDAAVEAGGGI